MQFNLPIVLASSIYGSTPSVSAPWFLNRKNLLQLLTVIQVSFMTRLMIGVMKEVECRISMQMRL